MAVQIAQATLISKIKRHLAIIGKRLYSKDGKNKFSDITLSSAEEKEILSQYIETSAHDIEAVLKQFISSSTLGDDMAFNIKNTRGDDDFEHRCTDLIATYIFLNAVGEYLAMIHPDLAQKYHRDAQQRIEMLITYVYYKKPPTL